MGQGRSRDWILRLGTSVLRPFGFLVVPAEQRERESLERRRLAATLGRERVKIAKLKQRLAQVEFHSVADSAKARAQYEALTLDRHPPRLSEALTATWTTASARARLRVHNRGSELDEVRARRGPGESPTAGELAKTLPALRPPIARGGGPTWRPLRIAVTDASAFSSFSDPRIRVGLLGDKQVEDADVLVFTRAESRTYLTDSRRVPDRLWERVRQGLTSIVFDASGEGHPHTAAGSVDLHAFLRAHGADVSRALYLTQDRQYPRDYETWCSSQGLRPMRTWIFDAFVARVLSEFRRSGDIVFEHRLAGYLTRPIERSRRFLSLNYTLRPSKAVFLLRLLRDGLWDRGWISFGGFASDQDDDGYTRWAVAKRLLAMDEFRDELETLLPLMDRLEAMEPVLFIGDHAKRKHKQRADSIRAADLEQYRDSWFSVVAVSLKKKRPHRITEKPLKPLLAFHPFLVLGNPGSLALLRGYGFETFGDVFDERYDEEPDPRRRFDMVYDQLRRLCALDEAEMARMAAELSEIVTFNACWGLSELPRRFRDTMFAELIDQLPHAAQACGPLASRAPAA